ncbi:MAG: imidazolonepropionase [Acidobacteria bacterium]|nr:imidazolonepropionase [Acidobacteriota bacterium]
MSGFLLVRGARQLLTLRGPSGPRRGGQLRDLGLIQDGALLIRNGVITSVGPSRRVENLTEARSAREIDASGRVVMPGFVDSHTHLVAGPSRLAEYETQLSEAGAPGPAPPGAGSTAAARSWRTLPASRLLLQARRRLETLIRHGTTTVEAKSGAGQEETGELKILRVLAALNERPLDVVATCLAGKAVPVEYLGQPDDYLHWMRTHLLPKIRRRRLARFVDVTCTPGGLGADQARICLEAARALGFRLKIHAEHAEHDGGARTAVELGATSADGLEHATADDVALLAASPTVATLLPANGCGTAQRRPPARALIDEGGAVALATGFNPTASSPGSMQMVMALACSHLGLLPAEALCAATVNGAHAVGLADRVGSLEAGKQADVLILAAPDYREVACHFGGNLVAMTLKRGQVLYQQGEVQWPED